MLLVVDVEQITPDTKSLSILNHSDTKGLIFLPDRIFHKHLSTLEI